VRNPKLATRVAGIFAVPLLLAGVTGGVTARTGFPGPAASFSISGTLVGVAATSASNAWAAGFTGSSASATTMIVRWNGTAWTRVPTPTPAGGGYLNGVTATSATSAWAVGLTYSTAKTLILRWNGSKWTQVPSPSPPGHPALAGVAATSASNAWAVGSTIAFRTLTERWNRSKWTQVPSPSAGGGVLHGVAATSASSVWAIGRTTHGNLDKTLILHWNSTA